MLFQRVPLLAPLLAVGVLVACGPLGPISGGRLRGSVEAPPADWSAAHAAETVQLESHPDDPYSVNVWCGALDGRLYVPTSLILGPDDPSEREWVRNAMDDPRVRLRVDGVVYELVAVRVDDPAEIEAARAMLLAKYETEPDEHSGKAWIFRLEPRPAGSS